MYRKEKKEFLIPVSVWKCDCGCFSKYFFMSKCIKMIFFFNFLNLFSRSAYQKDIKYIKKLIFNKNSYLNFLETSITPRSQTKIKFIY